MKLRHLLTSAALLLLSAGAVAQQQETFSNPVINADVPDPSMIRGGDYYYLVSMMMHL